MRVPRGFEHTDGDPELRDHHDEDKREEEQSCGEHPLPAFHMPEVVLEPRVESVFETEHTPALFVFPLDGGQKHGVGLRRYPMLFGNK